jgi:hypothetical protein
MIFSFIFWNSVKTLSLNGFKWKNICMDGAVGNRYVPICLCVLRMTISVKENRIPKQNIYINKNSLTKPNKTKVENSAGSV